MEKAQSEGQLYLLIRSFNKYLVPTICQAILNINDASEHHTLCF